jgi:NADPH2:quinone reductase
MAWEGRFLVIGFAAGEIPRPPLNLTLLKSCDIVGVFWGAFVGRDPATHNENVNELLTWFEEGRIKPRISASYPLEDVAKALRDLSERRVKGKVVVVP